MNNYMLSHLEQLEIESIHIIREVAAEFDTLRAWFKVGGADFSTESA